MKTPNDIINIVRMLSLRQKSKDCNREYYELFNEYIRNGCLLGLIYKHYGYIINHRFYNKLYIRMEIVCFLTDKETKYYIPKNY